MAQREAANDLQNKERTRAAKKEVNSHFFKAELVRCEREDRRDLASNVIQDAHRSRVAKKEALRSELWLIQGDIISIVMDFELWLTEGDVTVELSRATSLLSFG